MHLKKYLDQAFADHGNSMEPVLSRTKTVLTCILWTRKELEKETKERKEKEKAKGKGKSKDKKGGDTSGKGGWKDGYWSDRSSYRSQSPKGKGKEKGKKGKGKGKGKGKKR